MACVPQSAVCDFAQDCGDGSDEDHGLCCGPLDYVCDDGGCVDPALWCNGSPDCADASDEVPEVCNACPPGSFSCGDGNCVPSSYVCDDWVDCDNLSDEGPFNPSCTCEPTDFICNNGVCIMDANVCNGGNQCGDNSDEDPMLCGGGNCGNSTVDPGEACDTFGALCSEAGLTGGDIICDGNCSWDLSACNAPTGYGNCAAFPEGAVCTGEEVCATDGASPPNSVCLETGCSTAADCGPVPATGNAVVTCTDVTGDLVSDCLLSCEQGETCPDGMFCAFGFICLWPS
jgi:hypothetical protein